MERAYYSLPLFFDNVQPIQLDEHLILASALGLAIICLLTIGISVLHIPLNRETVAIAYFVMMAAVFIIVLLKKKKGFLANKQADRLEFPFAFILITITLLFIRALQIKDILVPNWIDGLFHADLLQRFVIKKAIPFDSIYHIGFHAIVLYVYYLFGIDLPEAILIVGQWVSALSGLTIYLLLKRFVRNTIISYVGVIIYSLFLLFPSHLVSWGRYPFLAGLALLPPVITLSIDWIIKSKRHYFITLIFIVAIALTHYGSLLYLLAFLMMYIIFRIGLSSLMHSIKRSKEILLRLIFLFAPLLIFIIP